MTTLNYNKSDINYINREKRKRPTTGVSLSSPDKNRTCI